MNARTPRRAAGIGLLLATALASAAAASNGIDRGPASDRQRLRELLAPHGPAGHGAYFIDDDTVRPLDDPEADACRTARCLLELEAWRLRHWHPPPDGQPGTAG